MAAENEFEPVDPFDTDGDRKPDVGKAREEQGAPGSVDPAEQPPGPLPLYKGELPPDIAEVWAGSTSEFTAKKLIQAWGVDGFRQSALHQIALSEKRRDVTMRENQKTFLKGKK